MSDNGKELPLPPGWSRGFSNSQKRTFYFHKKTKHTQWHFPTASEVADPAKAHKRAELNKEREGRKRKSDHHRRSSSSSGKKKSKSSSSAAAAAKKNDDDDDDGFFDLADTTCIAIIVPFRDLHVLQKRSEHLKKFIPHMKNFCSKLIRDGLISNYQIYIVNQTDDQRKFNRGKLLNVGFEAARKNTKMNHDVFIFHDVDLLPNDDLGPWYAQFPKSPIHIARVWDRYSNNPKYFGGVVSFSSSDYKRINGYPNNFWGWGGEDDETQRRLEKLRIKWVHPDKGTLYDIEQMNIKQKMSFLRENKVWKCMSKWELKDEHNATWKTNGLADLKYYVESKKTLEELGDSKAIKITVDVQLNGNHITNTQAGIDYMPPK